MVSNPDILAVYLSINSMFISLSFESNHFLSNIVKYSVLLLSTLNHVIAWYIGNKTTVHKLYFEIEVILYKLFILLVT